MEAEIMTPMGSTQLQAIRVEIDIQVATANKFKRTVSNCIKQAISMAIQTPEIAASMFFTLPRRGEDGENITGPSVRLAEVVATNWGNLRTETKVIETAEKYLVAEATVWDMERNVLHRETARRSIWGKRGRYSENMVQQTSQAAQSIALRNAIFRVIPRSIVDEVDREARRVAIGDAMALQDRLVKAVNFFKKMGAEEDRIFARFNARGIRDLGKGDLEIMLGLHTAIRDGETSVDDAFPPVRDPQPPKGGNGKPPAEQPRTRSQEALDLLSGNGSTGNNQAPASVENQGTPPGEATERQPGTPPPVDVPPSESTQSLETPATAAPPTSAVSTLDELDAERTRLGIPDPVWLDMRQEHGIGTRCRSKKKLAALAQEIENYRPPSKSEERDEPDQGAGVKPDGRMNPAGADKMNEITQQALASGAPKSLIVAWMTESGLDPQDSTTCTGQNLDAYMLMLKSYMGAQRPAEAPIPNGHPGLTLASVLAEAAAQGELPSGQALDWCRDLGIDRTDRETHTEERLAVLEARIQDYFAGDNREP